MKNIKIQTLIILGFTIILVLFAIMSGTTINEFKDIYKNSEKLKDSTIPQVLLAENIAFHIVEVQQWLSDVSLTHNLEGYEEAKGAYNEAKSNIEKLLNMHKEEKDIAAIQELETIQNILNQYYETGKKMAETYIKHGAEAGNAIMKDLDKTAQSLEEKIDKLKNDEVRSVNKDTEDSLNHIKSILNLAITLTIFALIASIIIAYSIIQTIQSALKNLMNIVTDFFKGDFSKEIITSESEIGQTASLLKQLQNRIKDVTSNMQQVISDINQGNLSLNINKQIQIEGEWMAIMDGFTKALTAVITPLKTAAVFVERISKGDIPEKVQGNYHGEFKEITGNLNSLIDSMKQIVHIAERLANGDLTITINPRSDKDSLMQGLSSMVQDLNRVIGNVLSIADQVASGSQTLSSTAQELSQGTTEQASSAEEIAASMEQMNANIEQNFENAKATNNIASNTSQEAVKGGDAVSKTVSAMKDIADKILIISEITRQTNMLALNAAIEAARAGEHGKGFAVVADAVRKLAERSQSAANSINELSTSSIKIAEEAGDMLQKIVPSIRKTAELVQEITAASNEQKTGGVQINKAIQQLDQVVQQNAAVAEEMSSTSEELAAQAEYLKDAVSFFTIAKREKESIAVKKRVEKQREQTKTDKKGRELLIEMKQKNIKQDSLDRDFESY
ncbi:MAG: methyl-accepting chemotaxis protein [Desulfobacterales bacterium]|nr:methyl-accepting chemotaxis protein [Desulfobacterales bacterium]MBF0395379.1 methyl-accepting chemotaxis protein [Desulfobacterales bacterium]